MMIYNQELGEDDCEFNVDDNTQKFLVSFFGFYNHYMGDNFALFLRELGVNRFDSESLDLLKLDSDFALDVYNVCDRRTFDLALVLPKAFTNKEEALNWFNTKLKKSRFLLSSDISEIDVLDADKFLMFLDKISLYENKVKYIDDVFKSQVEDLKQKMLKEFGNDDDYNSIIEEKFTFMSKLR